MKKILFVINTLGGAGAENALIGLLNSLETENCQLSLYVLMGQGELVNRIPGNVRLLNTRFSANSVLSKKGRRDMTAEVLRAFFRNGNFFGKAWSVWKNYLSSPKGARLQPDKILWRMMAEGGQRFEEEYDLAVAYLEGGAAYYVADYVKARKKAAFVHIDYESSGYTREMDRDCYKKMDRIFAVSDEVKKHFLKVYPQYGDKTRVFHNIIDQERIRREAKKPGGPGDFFDGIRILTVGRLTYQKAYDVAVEAMALIKKAGYPVRWYVLGEGDQRPALEKRIARLGLTEDFVLVGARDNPFPWYVHTDIYVHATRFEGKSIAIQEAQTLGCAIIASDCNGNREQIIPGEDGLLCELTPEGIAGSVIDLIIHTDRRKSLGAAAKKKQIAFKQEIQQLLELTE